MLYERTSSGSYQIIWYAWFDQLDLAIDNYSVMTHCDLDNDGLAELVVFLDAPAGKDCLYIYEYDPSIGYFPSVPTASWDLDINGGINEVGAIRADDVDNDGHQELVLYFYAKSPGAAHLMIIKNQGDVSQITFANNLTLLHDFMSEGGHVPTQLKILEPAEPNAPNDTEVCMYLATTDVNETQSNLFEIKYSTGDVTLPSNYTIASVFNETRQNDELFKISQFGFGDSDGNGFLDFVLASFSLDTGKPQVKILEESDPNRTFNIDHLLPPDANEEPSLPGDNGETPGRGGQGARGE